MIHLCFGKVQFTTLKVKLIGPYLNLLTEFSLTIRPTKLSCRNDKFSKKTQSLNNCQWVEQEMITNWC